MSSKGPKTGIKSDELSEADRRWWDSLIPRSDTCIRDLIEGFDSISDRAIPYARLPTRARSAYMAEFRQWADLADETIRSLSGRPRGGISTVRAVMIAARDAAAATRAIASAPPRDASTAATRMLADLSLRDRTLLAARVWQRPPLSMDETAVRLGVKPSWISRHQPYIRARFDEMRADPLYSAVVEYAERLRRRLGPVVREHNITSALHELGVDKAGVVADLLVCLAGPYTRQGTWWVRDSPDGLAAALAKLDAVFVRSPAPTSTELIRGLAAIGMPADVAVEFLGSRAELRRFNDRWVKWGETLADKAEAILHLRLKHEPASADMIAAAIGEPGRVSAVRTTLFQDPRFARASRQTWALRQWGLAEFRGIFTEITSRIDAAGGAVAVDELVEAITSAFPDVARSSVRVYAGNSAAFVTEQGMVRRRSNSDGQYSALPLRIARGAFRNGPKQVRVEIEVTHDVLRGSGPNLHRAIAAALGVNPGTERRFTGVSDAVIRWRLSSAAGPSVGSLRPLVAAVDASLGDTVVLAFSLDSGTVAVARIPAGERFDRRLKVLLGTPRGNPLAALGRALDCAAGEVDDVLRRRGDKRLADLLESTASEAPRDQ